jgi:hypothetical protein
MVEQLLEVGPGAAVVAATAGPKAVAAPLVPASGGTTVVEELVVVEDVLEGEDEEEAAVHPGSSSPSSLSLHALPFFPSRPPVGRSKFQRWEEDPGAGSSNDELAPAAMRPSYLDAARKALLTTPSSLVGALNAAQHVAVVKGTHPVPARRKRHHRRRTSAPDGHGTPWLRAV